MPARFDLLRDGGQVQRQCLDVAPGQHEASAFALLGADGAKDVGRCRAQVRRCTGPGAATALALPFHPASPAGTFGKSRPAPGELVLLANAGFVTEPNFQMGEINALRACDRRQTAGETVLKSSMAPAAWAW